MYDHGQNRDLLIGQNPTGRKRKQRYINSRSAAAATPSLVCFSLGFPTAFVDIVLIFAPWAAKGGVGPAAQEHLLAVLAQAQGLVTVHQHEAEHHLDTQQQGVKIPINSGDVYKRQVFESIVPEAKNMTDEEAATLLRLALTSEPVREYLKKRAESRKSE